MFGLLYKIKILIVSAVVSVAGLFSQSQPVQQAVQTPQQPNQIVSEISAPQKISEPVPSVKTSPPPSRNNDPAQQKDTAVSKVANTNPNNNTQATVKEPTQNPSISTVPNPQTAPESIPQQPIVPQCAPGAILCNGRCWTSCPAGQEFLCTSSGAVCKIIPSLTQPTTAQNSLPQSFKSFIITESINCLTEKSKIKNGLIEQRNPLIEKWNKYGYSELTQDERDMLLEIQAKLNSLTHYCDIYNALLGSNTDDLEKANIVWMNIGNDKAIIEDKYGTKSMVEFLYSCFSLYQGDSVRLIKSGSYMDGIGDDYILLNNGKTCKVWSGDKL